MKNIGPWLVLVLIVGLQGCSETSDDNDPGSETDDRENGSGTEPDEAVGDDPEESPDNGAGRDTGEDSSEDSDSDADDGDPEERAEEAWDVSATPGDGTVQVEWQTHPEASSYRLYHAAEPGLDVGNYQMFRDGARHDDVSSPHELGDLVNQRYVFIRVAAVVDGEEILLGEELAAAPAGVQPEPAELRNLALINRARQDPAREADRFGIALNEDLSDDALSPTPKQPLAFDTVLMKASRDHGNWMLATGNFSHTGEGGSSPTDRARAAGYPLGAWGGVAENLAWRSFSGELDQETIDAHHEGLFLSAGHRHNLLDPGHREVGVGHVYGTGAWGDFWTTSMITQKFGSARGTTYLTGFVHDAASEDTLYAIGDGRDDIMLEIDGYIWQPYAAGAFAIPLDSGTYELEVYGDAVDGVLVDSITIDDANVQRDVVLTGGGAQLR